MISDADPPNAPFVPPALPDPRLTAIEMALGGRNAFNRQIHINRAPGLVYFNNPKVACSSIKATVNRAVAARDGRVLEYADMADIHDRTANPLLIPRALGFEDLARMLWPEDGGAAPRALVFSFVRDPVARVCSAYLAKLSPAKRNSPQARRLWAALGLALDRDLSLADFVQLVSSDPAVRGFDPHWRDQRQQIAYDAVPWTAIGWHGRFAADFAALTRPLFGPLEVFDTRRAFDRVTASDDARQTLGPKALAQLEAAYAADFDMIDDIAGRGLFPATSRE